MLNLSREKSREIVCDDSEDFTVINDKIVDQSRWSLLHEIVVQHNDTKKFYKSRYSIAATEMQDELPYQYTYPYWVEVKPKEVTITIYVSEDL